MGSGRIITLVSYLVAKEGYTFVFSGPAPQCSNCRFRKVCVDRLRRGHVYRIVRVLGIKNKCPINNYVVTVEVEEAPVDVAIPKRLAVEGMIISYERVSCDRRECPYYNICNPRLLPSRGKVRVIKVMGRIPCPKGLPLVKASVMLV